MQTRHDAARVLRAIFVDSSDTRPLSRSRLSLRLRLPTVELTAAIDLLAARGLVDPARLRLTLPGLAVAAALGRRQETGSGSLRRPRAA